MRECISCHDILEDSNFHFRRDSHTFRTSCRSCENKRKQIQRSDTGKENRYKRELQRAKEQRLDKKHRGKFIVEDSRSIDRRKGLMNNISRDFVDDIIENGCSYCGDTTTTMTLDRIDNDIGHMVGNVVSCCYRCNIIRGNMPHEAWVSIVPAVKTAFQIGLFDSWNNIGPMKIKSGNLK